MAKAKKHSSTHGKHCAHCLHVCGGCDIAYCCEADCNKEWGACHQSHFPNWYYNTGTTRMDYPNKWTVTTAADNTTTTAADNTTNTDYPVTADCTHSH